MDDASYPRWYNKLPAKSRPSVSASKNPYPELIAWLIFLFLVFLFFNSLWIWFSLSVLADESMMRSYLQEVAGPESTFNLEDTVNQEYIKEIAISSAQTALFSFLFAVPLVFTWLRFREK